MITTRIMNLLAETLQELLDLQAFLIPVPGE